jgi:TolA-binding protein
MGRAIGYFNRDRLTEARPILLQITQRFPDYSGAPQALAALALSYYKEGDCVNTIRYYQQLAQRYPEHGLVPEAYFHQGLCLERKGDREAAAKLFMKVLALDPDGVYGRQAEQKVGP